jgi:anti-anti-sigma factor
VSDFTVDVTDDGPRTIVAMKGDLDLATAPILEKTLEEIDGAENHPELLIFDLRNLEFMDSTGLRIILSADTAARKNGRRFQLVEGPEAVHRVFRLTLMDQRLDFVTNLDDSDSEVNRGRD